MKKENGYTLVELLVAVVLVSMASVYALGTWSLSSRTPANKRVTEMGVYVGTQEVERLKAKRYLGLLDTSAGSPLVAYYDRYGAPAGGVVDQGYKTKAWVTPLVSRDGVSNSEDLRELKVEVWDAGETRLFETARTLVAFGGV